MRKNARTVSIMRISAFSGVLAGLIGGFFMGIVLCLGAYVQGHALMEPIARIASFWIGKRELSLSFWSLFLGVISHAFASACFGALFGFFTRKVRAYSSEVVAGIVFGAFIWASMTYLVLPLFDDPLYAFANFEVGLWFFGHMVYGFFLGTTATFKRLIWEGARNFPGGRQSVT